MKILKTKNYFYNNKFILQGVFYKELLNDRLYLGIIGADRYNTNNHLIPIVSFDKYKEPTESRMNNFVEMTLVYAMEYIDKGVIEFKGEEKYRIEDNYRERKEITYEFKKVQ